MDLKQIRLEMELTQLQLAKKARLSTRTIARAEHTPPGGHGNFTESTVIKLVRAYKISPEEADELFDLLQTPFELKGALKTHESAEH